MWRVHARMGRSWMGGFLALQPHRPVCAVFGGKLRWEGAEERKWEGEWDGGAGLEKLERFFLELSIFSLKVCHVDHLLSYTLF